MPRFIVTLSFLLLSAPAFAQQTLRLAVATTAEESGLISYLVREYRTLNPGLAVDMTVSGAINALQTAREGRADAVITHHPASEKLFVSEGYGASRTLIMSNGFAIFGPPADPLGLASETDIVRIMTKIAVAEPAFITQGDSSGTFRRLQELWESAQIKPDWVGYESTGSSSSATLLTAAEFGSYTFADMGTYLSLRDKIHDDIVPLVRDHKALRNYYSYLVVNGNRVPGAQQALAERFLDWLVSDAAQALIAGYKQAEYGVQLYEPAAHLDEALRARRAAERLLDSQRLNNALIVAAMLLAILAVWAAMSFRISAQLQARTQASEERFALAVAGSQDGIWDWDVPGQKFFCSERAAEVLRLTDPCDYPDLVALVRNVTTEEVWGRVAAKLLGFLGDASDAALDIDFPLKADGDTVPWVRLKGQALLGPRGTVVRVSGSIADTTETHRQAEELRIRSVTDELTQLPNRAAMMAHIDSVLHDGDADNPQAALFLLDVNGFKRINDTLGHHVGDELIKEIAHRLRSIMREGDFVARLGGDEFAVFMPINGEIQARHAGNRMHLALQRPMAFGEQVLNIDASIGAAFYPVHSDDAATLLRHAEVAMYQSKRLREPFSIYVQEMDLNSLRSLRLENDLRSALNNGSLQLFYQPKIHLPTRTLSGVEALLRWNHPELGLIPPLELIPLAERSGLMRPLTRWIINAALGQQAEWEASGLRIAIAINLSIWDLEDPSFTRYVERCIRQHGATPGRIEFEITESMMMTDPEHTLATLTRLRQLGVRLSIDDFGTGFSSLAYLKRFPVTAIKIDKSFVQKIPDGEKDQAIVHSIVSLAHSLGLEVVGEGVEDAACLKLLVDLGCDIGQGYHISRPVAAVEFEHWIGKSGFGYAAKPQITSIGSKFC